MTAGHYRWVVGNLTDGRITRTVDVIDYTWSTSNVDATLDGAFPLRSGDWPTARQDAAAGRTFLAVAYIDPAGGETFIDGGPIWTTKYQGKDGHLRFGAADLASYFDHRKVMRVLAAGENPATTSVNYSGRELALIAKRLVELAQEHTGGHLPIVMPDDDDLGGPGTTHVRNYPGYELATIGERLGQLRDVIGGPEIRFTPRRRADDPRFLEWVMEVGLAANGGDIVTGRDPVTLDLTAPGSAVVDLDVDTDASDLTMRGWVGGEGEEQARPIAHYTDPTLLDAGYPLLESELTGTDTVSDAATLDAHSRSLVRDNGRPVEAWVVTVHRDGPPHVGTYMRGDPAVVVIGPGHEYLPAGEHTMRIATVAGSPDDHVVLTMHAQLQKE